MISVYGEGEGGNGEGVKGGRTKYNLRKSKNVLS